jgi:hypothetical protein
MERVIAISVRCHEDAIITNSYKMDITAMQEIRWTGEGIIDRRDHNFL